MTATRSDPLLKAAIVIDTGGGSRLFLNIHGITTTDGTFVGNQSAPLDYDAACDISNYMKFGDWTRENEFFKTRAVGSPALVYLVGLGAANSDEHNISQTGGMASSIRSLFHSRDAEANKLITILNPQEVLSDPFECEPLYSRGLYKDDVLQTSEYSGAKQRRSQDFDAAARNAAFAIGRAVDNIGSPLVVKVQTLAAPRVSRYLEPLVGHYLIQPRKQ